MKTAMLGFLAETPIHPGAGRGVGVVDLPVAREASTDYPVIVGSSLKGALRDKAKTVGMDDMDARFGKQDRAGDLVVSDGRLLLLPVRSLTASFRWATCPHLIERYRRDLARAGVSPQPRVPDVGRGSVLTTGKDNLFLEERQFRIAGESAKDLANAIEPLLLHEETRNRLASRIAVLNDNDFAWFARYGLAIQARNNLSDDGAKKSVNLWYEETLPPDTVMYALIAARGDEALGALDTLFPDADPYVQAGGNETVGHGWFGVTVRRGGEGGAA